MNRITIAEPAIGSDELDRVRSVLESGQLADGPVVRAFERQFADYCEAGHGVATANGTTALHTALVALGVGPGDVVVTTPFSFVATANAIRFAGATPAFVDIDPRTFTLDPEAVETFIEESDDPVSAVIVVHLYGLPAPMDAFEAIGDSFDCAIIEDAAQAHGASYRGQPVGSFGDAACFSFYPTKNMTTGEGGMVLTDDAEVADRAARFVNHGRSGRYTHAELGHNFRLSALAAAVGLAQLERLDEFVERRRRNATLLTEALTGVPGLELPAVPETARHAYHQYTVRVRDRDALATYLDQRGIETGVYYPTSIHQLEAYEHVDCSAPRAELAAEEVLSLPVHPGVTRRDIDRVAAVVKERQHQETTTPS